MDGFVWWILIYVVEVPDNRTDLWMIRFKWLVHSERVLRFTPLTMNFENFGG